MNKSFWQGKKVFLTGHTGFKGSWLSAWLLSLGATVKGYALEAEPESLFKGSSVFKKMDSFIGDIRDLELLQNQMTSFDPDIVIHMAAQPLVRYSYQHPVETYSTNVMGTVHVLEAARSCKNLKAVINVTTDKVYENLESQRPYREDDRLGGYDPYSNSKACSELVTDAYRNSFFNLKNYKDHHVSVASARAGNVIGGGDWAEDRLIPDFYRAYRDNKTLQIRNPNSIRPWQHVLEAVRGYMYLAEALYTKGPEFAQAWNFGPFETSYLTVGEIINQLAKDTQLEVKFETDGHYHETQILKLDWAKSKDRLKWSPVFGIDETLADIKNFYLSALSKPKDLSELMLQSINNYEKTIAKNGKN